MHEHDKARAMQAISGPDREPAPAASVETASRRTFLKAGASVAASGAAAAAMPSSALAQAGGDVEAELVRLQGARRVLFKGAVVLTLDRQVGDFARSDVLIEDGKIREVRPDI